MKAINFILQKRRIKKAIDELDSTVIIPRWDKYSPNFYYFGGIDLDHSILILHKDGGITLLSNRLNESFAREHCGKFADIVILDKNKTVKEVLGKLCGKTKCLLDVSSISYATYRKIHMKKAKPIAKEFLYLREVKDNEEVMLMRTANKRTLKIVEKIGSEEIKGKSEEELKKAIIIEIVKCGCKEAFDTIVANSKNARYPHYTTSGNERIRDYALIDMGARYKNYNSDITRCIGDLSEMSNVYETLQHVSLEIADVAYAGKKISDLVSEADTIIKKNGLREFPHGIGHGIGLDVHEFPYFHMKSKDTLKENSVITIEPGQYYRKGLRYENMYIIGKKRAKLI